MILAPLPQAAATDVTPVRSNATHEKQHDEDDQDDADDTDTTSTIAVTAEAATEAAKQEDDEDDNEYESDRRVLSAVAARSNEFCLLAFQLWSP